VKQKNKLDEHNLRQEYKKADRLYTDNLQTYDLEMKELTRSKEQA